MLVLCVVDMSALSQFKGSSKAPCSTMSFIVHVRRVCGQNPARLQIVCMPGVFTTCPNPMRFTLTPSSRLVFPCVDWPSSLIISNGWFECMCGEYLHTYKIWQQCKSVWVFSGTSAACLASCFWSSGPPAGCQSVCASAGQAETSCCPETAGAALVPFILVRLLLLPRWWSS